MVFIDTYIYNCTQNLNVENMLFNKFRLITSMHHNGPLPQVFYVYNNWIYLN